jgi:hypothetical protein
MVDAPPRQPALSTMAVRAPMRAAAIAAATPALPPPATMTSYFYDPAMRGFDPPGKV